MIKEEISLVYNTLLGNTPVENKVDVLAEVNSIMRQEFYASHQSGLKPNIQFTIWKYDYDLTRTINPTTKKEQYATVVIYNEARYNIIRTFTKDEKTELICG